VKALVCRAFVILCRVSNECIYVCFEGIHSSFECITRYFEGGLVWVRNAHFGCIFGCIQGSFGFVHGSLHILYRALLNVHRSLFDAYIQVYAARSH